MWNREEVFHAVLPHVLFRADAMATTIVLTIPAVTIYVNLGFEGLSCDAIAEESIPTLYATGEERYWFPDRGARRRAAATTNMARSPCLDTLLHPRDSRVFHPSVPYIVVRKKRGS
jgi:hypothetical protein